MAWPCWHSSEPVEFKRWTSACSLSATGTCATGPKRRRGGPATQDQMGSLAASSLGSFGPTLGKKNLRRKKSPAGHLPFSAQWAPVCGADHGGVATLVRLEFPRHPDGVLKSLRRGPKRRDGLGAAMRKGAELGLVTLLMVTCGVLSTRGE